MPKQHRNLAAIVHSRRDLPRPLGVEVTRQHSVTVYLTSLPAFNEWVRALHRAGPLAEDSGWRFRAGWLPARTPASVTVGDTVTDGWIIDPEVQAFVTLMARLPNDQEGTS